MTDKSLKIGIDARELEGKRTGVGRYLINLLREWAEMAPHNRYVLFFMRDIPEDEILKKECFLKRLIKLPGFMKKNLLWEQIFLPLKAQKENLDLFFSPSYTVPLFIKGRTIVTIHDISYEINPDWFPLREALIRRLFTRLSTKKADAIITISEFSKRDILKSYKLNDRQVKVIYPAADRIFSSIPEGEKIAIMQKKYNTGGRFLLYVGSILNRRPIEILIKAFSMVVKEYKKLQLVIIGENRTRPKKDIDGLIDSLEIGKSVMRLDYVPDADLVHLYKTASIFIYPSLYEGFGLPLLEAMAAGTPVIVPNVSSLPEVVGDSGLLIDRIDEVEMARAIATLIKDEALAKSYIIKGKKRAEEFSWKKAAEEHLELFRDAAGG